ncbi:MAG: hypothetical protein WAV46_04130 [Candidatus Moraniibacteriota bacterium]
METGSEFTTKVLQAFNEGQTMAYRSLWDIGMVYLAEHWMAVIISLLVIFAIAVARALAGHWGMLGSFLYNFLFLGTLFIIGLIWEPEVFANDYIKVGLAFLYIICFLMVGRILDWSGVRSRY